MHTSPQFQADFAAQGHGVGAYAHFLVGGDARVCTAQVRCADTATGQQRFAGQAFGVEGAEHQRDGVERGEMRVEHARFLPERCRKRASCVPGMYIKPVAATAGCDKGRRTFNQGGPAAQSIAACGSGYTG